MPGLRITRLERQDVRESVSATQPDVWSFVDFEADDEVADQLATALAGVLRTEDGWYADFTVAAE